MKLNVKSNDKISPLPSGLENARFRVNGKVKNYQLIINKNKNIYNHKTKKILCSFNENTNFEERYPLLQIAEEHSEIEILRFDDRLKYIDSLSQYKFNLCPEGNNYESHRIWESLLLGCTPVVIKNNVNENFFNLGVPLLILNSWDELKKYNFSDLEEMNKVNLGKNYEQFSTFKFWNNFIESKFIH